MLNVRHAAPVVLTLRALSTASVTRGHALSLAPRVTHPASWRVEAALRWAARRKVVVASVKRRRNKMVLDVGSAAPPVLALRAFSAATCAR